MAIRLGHDGDDFAETHEINVTPFIDVILVLLIIFMIAAPLATVDVPVDLPATTAQKQERPDKPVFLTIKADRSLAMATTRCRPARWLRRWKRRRGATMTSGFSSAPIAP